MWVPKACLGMLGNVLSIQATSLAVLGMLCNVLGMLATSLVDLSMLTRGLVVHYSLYFTAYKAESGGVFFRCGMPRLQSMPRSAKDVVKHAKDVAKHAEDVAKHADK